jgi:3-oxoacyl-[acyl-carrier-protein] synthase II
LDSGNSLTVKDVVVTGMGAITPIGNTVSELWESLISCKSGAGFITRFDASTLSTKIAAELKEFNPEDHMDRKDVRRADRFVQYGIAAARQAAEDAGVSVDKIDPTRFGVIIGSGIGGIGTFEEQHTILMNKGPSRVSPFFIPMMIADMAAGQISMILGAKGPNFATVSACASGAHAIGEAFRILQKGDADVILCGGTEAAITPMGIGGFCSMKAMSTRETEPERASRPFDKERDGFVMGEGAGMVVLETLEHALARKADKIYARMSGYGATADAHHITAPSPDGEGAARAMKLAIADSGLKPEDVDYLNAHGTSTPLNDKFETIAVKSVFGDYAYKLPVGSTKSMTGHLLGAAGGVEFITCVLSMNSSTLPPTINYENPDPDCDLDYIPNTPRQVEVKAALTNSLGFGGHNVTLAVTRYEDGHKA